MSNSKLISIITPFYNSKRYFNKTLESVLSQTYKKWEWIIIDDCSSKGESSYLDEIAKKDKRIQVFHIDVRRGPAFCRNAAIKRAKGQYIAFLDSDDYWVNTKLEKQFNFMVENNYDFTATYFNVYDEKHRCITKLVKAPAKCTHKKLIKLNYLGCLTVMYNKSIFPDLSIPQDIAKRNDYALWLKLSEKAPCYVLKECLGTYVRHFNNSVSSVGKAKMIDYHRDMFEKLYGCSKSRAKFYARRNGFFYVFKELFYVSKVKDDSSQPIENHNLEDEKIATNIFDETTKYRSSKRILLGNSGSPIFKAVLNETDMSPYTVYTENGEEYLSSYLRVYVDAYSVGVFAFFFSTKFDQEFLSQRIRYLKEQKYKGKDGGLRKTKDLFAELNNFDYAFAVYRGEGEHILKPSDFSKINTKTLIVLEK